MTDHVGQQFGNYRLIRSLGEGGFAKVYLGKHIALGEQVAVKVLRACLADEEAERFRDEARAIADLKHPNIVRVLDFGIEDAAPYIVMEYVPNGSLPQHLPGDTALPTATVVSYVRQIAAALQYAHDKEIIHRDVKPANMLMRPDGNLLLSDFGIAVIAQSRDRTGSSQLDEASTPPYMAPEQFQGNPCYASDQYALALIVYEWLCGTPLVRESHRETRAQDLPTCFLFQNKASPTIAPALEEVVRKGLTRDPQQRFASISAFAKALEGAAQVIDRAETCTKESDFPSHSLEDEQLFEDLVTASRQLKEEESLEEALTELSWLERTCLLLRVDASFNIAEIAEIVGTSEREVYVSLDYGHKRLLEICSSQRKEPGVQTSQCREEDQAWEVTPRAYSQIDILIRNLPDPELLPRLQPKWRDQARNDNLAGGVEARAEEVNQTAGELPPSSEITYGRSLEIDGQEWVHHSAEHEPKPVEEPKLAEEAALVQQVSNGDADALVKLYECYVDSIYRFCYNRVGNISEAEVLTSETFTQAIEALLRGANTWQGKPFGTWLYGIAINLLQKRNKKLRDAPPAGQVNNLPECNGPPSEEANILDATRQKEERDALWQLVDELPLAEQSVLIMCHVYDLPYAQIAERLKRSEKACRRLHQRALERLRQKMLNMRGESSAGSLTDAAPQPSSPILYSIRGGSGLAALAAHLGTTAPIAVVDPAFREPLLAKILTISM